MNSPTITSHPLYNGRDIDQVAEQCNRYRAAALVLYGPLKIMIAAMPPDAVGKRTWQARLNAFRHAFDIQY